MDNKNWRIVILNKTPSKLQPQMFQDPNESSIAQISLTKSISGAHLLDIFFIVKWIEMNYPVPCTGICFKITLTTQVNAWLDQLLT